MPISSSDPERLDDSSPTRPSKSASTSATDALSITSNLATSPIIDPQCEDGLDHDHKGGTQAVRGNDCRGEFTAPPWYYLSVMSLLKPLYRLSVWRRSKNNDNYDNEVAERFGHSYPSRPVPPHISTHKGRSSKTSSSKAVVDQAASNKVDRIDSGDKPVKQSSQSHQGYYEDHGHQRVAPSDTVIIDETLHTRHKQGVIWCHAVSLGETNTIAPLLEQLLAEGFGIWLTNTTQTGHARAESRFAKQIAAGHMSHSYVPVDSTPVVEAFLEHVQPVAALFVETELWATTLSRLASQQIPAILVNARLSASSFKRYQKIDKVTASMMQNLSLIIAQDAESAKRFRQLGAPSAKIRVAGSLKWVVNQPQVNVLSDCTDEPSLNDQLTVATQGRPVWVAASTHEGEESIALAVQQQLLTNSELTKPLLIIVPRHPERFSEVAALIERANLTMARRSLHQSITEDIQVYLADTMGELMHWYQIADVAVVGGSMVDIGGHNPIEPLSVATPVIMGPFTQSCQEVVDTLVDKGALYQLPATKSPAKAQSALQAQLERWLINLDSAHHAGQLGYKEVEHHQLVLQRQLDMIKTVIKAHAW
ncbi:3-deoxy-D-manno-octulosonic acid transferase [Psychrobacter pygoscelis]|uniref:3-deoxy-D-manno-octulosonic acid transferase n=1 Tax=Psychrobacter pygoscelis TaxID=2488563 RepID=UPI001F614BD9|nr:3-deoxy-D-manno-octulosonic acid transferase [Psychrobacter pygoscelis]